MPVIKELRKDACLMQRAEKKKSEGWKEQRQVRKDVQDGIEDSEKRRSTRSQKKNAKIVLSVSIFRQTILRR